MLPAKKRRKRNSHEKFSADLTTCKKLANVLSLCSESDFERKLAQLEKLNELWTEKKEVGLQLLEVSSTSSSSNSASCEILDDGNEVEMEEENSYGDPCPEVSAWLTGLVSKVVEEEKCVDFFHEGASVPSSSLTVTKLDIKMPPPITRKGRPKGAGKTVIGLPKRGGKAKGKPVKFVDLTNPARERMILDWCVGKDAAALCRASKRKISPADVDPTEIAPEIYHPQVCLKTVKYLFDVDAWEKLLLFYEEKMELLKNQCHACLEICETAEELINCGRCLQKFHFTCGKCKKTSKGRQQWFCNQCKIDAKCNED